MRSQTVVVNRPRGLALVGLLTVLDGAWGAIVPFVGPLFGYRSHGQDAWQWSTLHGELYVAPGAVAVLFGLIILARARSVTRGPVGFAGLVVAACGAWFVIGPALWPTFGTGPVFTPAASAMDNFVNQVGYNLGVGVILAVLGGMALKALARDREVAVEGREPFADDRRPAEPTRREPYAGDRRPMSAPVVGAGVAERRAAAEPVAESRVADADDPIAEERAAGEPAAPRRVPARDRGSGAPSSGVGNRSLRQPGG
ncbi:MAG: hypothetical protein M3Y91_04205 [Actinomycetota bacterium]|nr:hypothetical protein [Actinomycetota bacterium]